MNEELTLEGLERAAAGNILAVASLPKVDLHAHAPLSAPWKTYHDLSGGTLPHPPNRFSGLNEFLDTVLRDYLPLLSSPEIASKVFRDILDHMIADGITYTELSFDLFMPRYAMTTWKRLARDLQKVCDEYRDRITVSPELGIPREATQLRPRQLAARVSSALKTGFFDGIDVYGNELLVPISKLGMVFSMAKNENLRIKFHAGEVGHPHRVLEEIDYVSRYKVPKSIQHGITPANNPEVLAELSLRQVQLNICPASNVKLSLVPELDCHPIRAIVEAGVPVTIGSDDFGVFGSSVSQQYVDLFKTRALSVAALERIRRQGLGNIPA